MQFISKKFNPVLCLTHKGTYSPRGSLNVKQLGNCFMSVAPRPQHASEFPGGFAKTQIAGGHCRVSDSVGLGRGLTIGIFSSHGMLMFAGPGPHTGNH